MRIADAGGVSAEVPGVTYVTARFGGRVRFFVTDEISLRAEGAYRLVIGLTARELSLAAGARGHLSRLPLAGGWTRHRDLPAPAPRTFMAEWQARSRT